MLSQDIPLEWLLVIPVVAGFIGWFTNWLAIKMIFYPKKYLGIRLGRLHLGWQGIIHRKADGFARVVGKQVSEQILQSDTLIPEVDPKIANEFIDRFPELWNEIESGQLLPDLLGEQWEKMSPMQRQMVSMQIRFDSRSLFIEIIKMTRQKFIERFDMRAVVTRRLSNDSHLLAKLYGDIARPELKRIEVFGLYFGFFIGAAEALLFSMFELNWLIFIFGILIGAFTNWLAIEMIFKPRHPVNILGFKYQGLFPKRQSEIAVQFGEIGATHVLPVSALVEEIMATLQQQDFIGELEDTSKRWLTRIVENYRSHLPDDVSSEWIANKAVDLFYQKKLHVQEELSEEFERLLAPRYRVSELITENLLQLPKEKFERVLRIVVEQDETTLILIGAVIGFMISAVQFSVFS